MSEPYCEEQPWQHAQVLCPQFESCLCLAYSLTLTQFQKLSRLLWRLCPWLLQCFMQVKVPGLLKKICHSLLRDTVNKIENVSDIYIVNSALSFLHFLGVSLLIPSVPYQSVQVSFKLKAVFLSSFLSMCSCVSEVRGSQRIPCENQLSFHPAVGTGSHSGRQACGQVSVFTELPHQPKTLS